MTKFMFLYAIAILSIITATQARANGIEGREVAARTRSAMCTTDLGLSPCSEPMCVFNTGGDHKIDALCRNGANKPNNDWLANMNLG
jgi:hypothetical protein